MNPKCLEGFGPVKQQFQSPEVIGVFTYSSDEDTLLSFINEVKKHLIHKTLCKTEGNISKAARILNINRTTLIMCIKSLGIKVVRSVAINKE